ncbi:transcription intermediary factor 1-alpha-like [Girardinichthys multiradiatus]|uniref:transcription intermediary factor 1-alpha-like n=1 Tax=Girardinichthys multiradiatus TaxID=208333 RepID=UPI001FAE24FA|nr:transcription intermediary factor 1-alpha-like [Girardinichthys multiradiatus]XP_047236979.1 transcription intermediary factor 1-alpha-like [Girardinichthys multiradiatus]XP_047236986.1 transcription intermediary factor 1-alpha-like [Girardinichthys multiradiatus]XP_047236987.1 transcription intermediary factor 1-alpha-like [Girardinichthys multiradiatus]
MAGLTKRCHSNFPQRRATSLPRGAGCRVQLAPEVLTPEIGPYLATAAEEQVPVVENLTITGLCHLEKEANWSREKIRAASSGKLETQADKSVKALLKRIRIHPEAQRILGNSPIAVVNLERLNFQSVSSSSLQPVVSLVRLPVSLSCSQQNGFSSSQEDILDVKGGTPKSEAAESADECQAEDISTFWTEPYFPESSSCGEPEQDSGFDCESNPDQPYILLDSGSDDGKSNPETFYLDPDAQQAVLIQLEPEAEANQDLYLELEDDPDIICEAEVFEMEHNEDRSPDLCCLAKQETESGAITEQMESEDFCAVCMNGGDLLCCDRCPKVYHLACHIPSLNSFPIGDWVCTLCRTDKDPVENTQSCGGVRVPYTLSDQDQRRCEKLSLLLYCHTLSVPFHEPVSPLARNYYQIIKRPIDLSVIRRKLDKCNTLHYFTAEQFVDDILLMFKNCATFNYPDSEVAQAGRTLEVFFLSNLKEIFPDQAFPSASQDRMNKARNRWLSRKRRHVFSGRKFYL